MNVSTIADMFRADPALYATQAARAAFKDRMNVKDQRQVIQQPVIVQQAVERFVSIAEMNGGPCTGADLKAAKDMLDGEPLKVLVRARIDKVQAAIESGSITTEAQAISLFGS